MWSKPLLAAYTILLLVASTAANMADETKPAKPDNKTPAKKFVRVTISKETTYITEPLQPNGYPDYVGALNKRMSEGVTPQNNSAVLFWQAFGPNKVSENIRERFFKMLGIPMPPEKGDYFVTSDEHQKAYVARLVQEGKIAAGQAEDELKRKLDEQLQEAMRRPWSKDEFPAWAEWIAVNEKPLALLVEASKRPRRYDPLIGGDPGNEMAISILLPGPQFSREAARALAARAMLRLGEVKVDVAWQDLLATHRLARLVGQGFCLVEALVAVTIDGVALTGDQALAEYSGLSPAQLLAMRDELTKLPPLPKMVAIMDEGERLSFLDCIASLSRKGFSDMSAIVGDGGGDKEKGTLESFVKNIGLSAIDWDLVLKLGNTWFDRAVANMKIVSRAERLAAENTFVDELRKMATSVKDPQSLALEMLGGPRKAVSERIGHIMVSLLLPASQAAEMAEDCAKTRFNLTLLSFALAAYRADNDVYPDKLEQLKPKYAAELPKDIFNSDGPLQYSRTKDGYLLYSFGPNGRDDGGRGLEDRPEGTDYDDLAVRVPSNRKPAD